MKKIYLLPNLFTTASLFCGLLAIIHIFNVATSPAIETHRYELACWLILASAILDLLDGWVARMTRSESQFGVQYDSLSDLVAFGVAPAMLIYMRLAEMENPHVAEVVSILFVICGALRLARFNVQKSTTERVSFTGLPIPAAAGTLVSAFLFLQTIDPDWNAEFILRVLPVLTVGLSYLMVSNVPYPSFKQFNLERRKKFDVLPLVVLLVAVAVALKNHLRAVIAVGFLVYVIGSLVLAAYRSVTGTAPASGSLPVRPGILRRRIGRRTGDPQATRIKK